MTRQRQITLRRNLRDASDPLSVPENIFRGIFRLSRELAHQLIIIVSPHLREITRPQIAIPEQLKILTCLHFLSQGDYQKSVAQDFLFPMSQSSVSRCITDVTSVINNQMNELIKFPTSEQELNNEKMLFIDEFNGFPGIIGALDCTHIAIHSPPVEDPNFPAIAFLNRKGFYSLNVQIICNAKLKILAINARYPGSVHDSAIWTTSIIHHQLRQQYERGDRSTWLIGDAGYALQPWLMTPIGNNDQRNSARAYNVTHRRCRNVIERLNGNLKSRFRCLLRHRVLHYGPAEAARIINTCAILHNFCKQLGDDLHPDEYVNENIDANEQGDDDNNNNIPPNWLQEGRITRERILLQYI